MILLFFLALNLYTSDAFTSTRNARASLSLQATATTKEVVYDGPEWTSIQSVLGVGNNDATIGKMTVVVGLREDTGDKVVGVVASEPNDNTIALQSTSLQIHADSMASVPKSVPDQDAVNTMIAALSGVQCTLPRVEGVGGASATAENGLVSGKVVILGGSEYACFAAEGLAAMGTQVSLVSTNKVKVQHQNGKKKEQWEN